MAKVVRDKDQAVLKVYKERMAEQIKINAESVKRTTESRPTPTQEENDLAKLGVKVELEPDGTGETVITRTVVANVPHDPGYVTREARPLDSSRPVEPKK